MKEIIKYEIEIVYVDGDEGWEEIITFVVKDSKEQASFCVKVDVGEAHNIDGLGVRKAWIPVSSSEVELSIPPEQLNDILALLEDEGKVESGEGGHANIPYNYYFTLEEPYRISTAFYQDRYYDEITEWLREFLAEDGTVARILSMVKTEVE